jgi:hypothetical protein
MRFPSSGATKEPETTAGFQVRGKLANIVLSNFQSYPLCTSFRQISAYGLAGKAGRYANVNNSLLEPSFRLFCFMLQPFLL